MTNFFKDLFSSRKKATYEEARQAEIELNHQLGEAVKKQDIEEIKRLLTIGANPNGNGIFMLQTRSADEDEEQTFPIEKRIMDLNYENGNSFRPEGRKSAEVDELLRSFGGKTSADLYAQRRQQAEARYAAEKGKKVA